MKRKTERIRFRNISVPAAIRSSILEFPNAQTGNVTKVTNINLEKDYVLFDFFSELMRYLQPTSFPLSKYTWIIISNLLLEYCSSANIFHKLYEVFQVRIFFTFSTWKINVMWSKKFYLFKKKLIKMISNLLSSITWKNRIICFLLFYTNVY